VNSTFDDGNSPQKTQNGQKAQSKKEEVPFVLFVLFVFFVVNCRHHAKLRILSSFSCTSFSYLGFETLDDRRANLIRLR
jgi:hypothetical protein